MAYASSFTCEMMVDPPCVNEVAPALKLAASQLADVLAHVSPKDRMRSCALVCKAFYMASVLATRRVVLEDSYGRDSYTAGCRWLQTHGQAVGVTSLSFKSHNHREFSEQHIWDQLATLQQLEFTYIRIPPLPAAVLTSLTYLHCKDCSNSVDSLPDLTQLQHLALLFGSHASDESRSRQVSVLQQALPHLRALTHLSLSHQLTRDAALQALQELPCLQELLLHFSDCTAATFEVLSASLTRLEIQCSVRQQEELQLLLGLNSAAAVKRLTGLQHMKLHNVPAVHPDVLAALTGLQQLEVTSCVLAAGPREAGWSVLGRLTNLQRLNLWRTTTGTETHTEPQLTAADVAALTASSQLSYLNVSSRMLQEGHYLHLMPGSKMLHELYATMDLLEEPDVELWARCPKLRVLDLSQAAQEEGRLQNLYDYEFADCFRGLASLSELTALKLNFSKLRPDRATWATLGDMDQLRSLGLSGVDWHSVHGVLELRSCRQLTQLEVTAEPPEWEDPRHREETVVSVVNQAPEGCPSDLWYRVPQELLHQYLCHEDEVGGWDSTSLACLAQAAASIGTQAVSLHDAKQQEVQVLHQQLGQAQEQMDVLQRQVQAMSVQMQAGMDAMAAQLQAMQVQLHHQQQQLAKHA